MNQKNPHCPGGCVDLYADGCKPECVQWKQTHTILRPTVDEYFIAMAELVALRSTCRRRQVGCVLVNIHNHVIATGYNGVARGTSHCIDIPCPGAYAESGTNLDACQAIHAEANALLQCRDTLDIHTVYCTASPCTHCLKLLMNTGATHIRFAEEYPHIESRNMWLSSRPGGLYGPKARTWKKLENNSVHVVRS